MEKITPCLWFDDQAEEAANFYTSLFKNSAVISVDRYPEGSPRPTDMVMTVLFQLEGRQFLALNGGPEFTFTEAISLSIDCESQAEVDELWERLSEGGTPGPCGWVKDRYGLSWQVVPRVLNELLADPDKEKASRVMQAMLAMGKIDIQGLRDAYAGKG